MDIKTQEDEGSFHLASAGTSIKQVTIHYWAPKHPKGYMKSSRNFAFSKLLVAHKAQTSFYFIFF